MLIAKIVLIALCAFFGALMDRINMNDLVGFREWLTKKYSKSWKSPFNESFWKPHFYYKGSWLNKYVDQNISKGRRKWKGIIIPVMFCDGWHLSKAFFLVFGAFAIGLPVTTTWFIELGMLIIIYTIVFEICLK